MFTLKFSGENFEAVINNLITNPKQGFGVSENADTQMTKSLNIFSNDVGFNNLKNNWNEIKKVDISKVNDIAIYEEEKLVFSLEDINIVDMNYSINIHNNSSSNNQNEVIQITYK